MVSTLKFRHSQHHAGPGPDELITRTPSSSSPFPPCPVPVPRPSLTSMAPPSLGSSTSSTPTASPAGNIYPSTTFPLSKDSFERSKQLAAITDLEAKYSVEGMSHHQFEWSRSTSEGHEDEWLPIYMYWRPLSKNTSPSVEEIWREWAFGLDGCLSVSELTAGWGARWRRNNSASKTEATRRKKIIALIETLAKKPNWNSELALRFLKDRYPIPTRTVSHLKTTRAFIDHLQKNGMEEILSNSSSYP
jgi:hypothetical protein